MKLILLAHAAATLYMAGLIWFVQLVHYPLFAEVGPDDGTRTAYARAHASRATWAVGPMMLLELVTTAALVWPLVEHRGAGAALTLPGAGAALLAVVWLSTALLQVPLHDRLGRVMPTDERVTTVRRLVRTNALRTGAWSLRALVALALLHRALG